MAALMSQQEASGFRFDTEAAERVRGTEAETEEIQQKITSIYRYVPGKVFTPKRANKKQGYSWCSFTKLTEFNPTSRQHIAWALRPSVKLASLT